MCCLVSCYVDCLDAQCRCRRGPWVDSGLGPTKTCSELLTRDGDLTVDNIDNYMADLAVKLRKTPPLPISSTLEA